jgi:predicted trehalose synthase
MVDVATLSKEAPYITALIAIVLIFVRAIGQMQAANAKSQDSRDALWREFLTEQRVQTTSALSRLSAEIKDISRAVASIHAAQLQHDSWNRVALGASEDNQSQLQHDAWSRMNRANDITQPVETPIPPVPIESVRFPQETRTRVRGKKL